jgi:F-type H+-transporting ATPase subunit b
MMGGRARIGVAAVLLSAALVIVRAAEGQPGHEPPARPVPEQGIPRPTRPPAGPDHLGRPMQIAPNPHGGQIAAQGTHAAEGIHAAPEHGDHAEHDESGPPPPINWWHGFLGEKADVPPSALWRAPGEPPPFLASLINFAALVAFAVIVGKKPLRQALVKRKETMLRDIEDAQRMRDAAQKRLAEYETKLDKIHEELERVRRDFRAQGERDKERIVLEAKERRERLKRDAEILISQEAKQMRQELIVEIVGEATRLAGELLAKEMTLGDHDKFAETFLAELRSGARPRGLGVARPSTAPKEGLS